MTDILILILFFGAIYLYIDWKKEKNIDKLIESWNSRRFQYGDDNVWLYEQTGYKNKSGRTIHDTMDDAGAFGEYLIFLILRAKKQKHILCNVYIPTQNRETTEIDLLTIDKKGIHVIESKNYSGIIDSNAYKDEWYQLLNHERQYFHSPVEQNNTHIRALKKLLNLKDEHFFSYIVFGTDSRLRGIIPAGERLWVDTIFMFSRAFSIKNSRFPNKFTDEQVECIYNNLKRFTLVSDEAKEKHKQNLKKREYPDN